MTIVIEKLKYDPILQDWYAVRVIDWSNIMDKRFASELPEELRRPTVFRMKEDEIGYVVPWSIIVDNGKKMWIDTTSTVEAEPSGTVTTKIKKVKDGVEVERTTLNGHRFDVGTSTLSKNTLPVYLVDRVEGPEKKPAINVPIGKKPTTKK